MRVVTDTLREPQLRWGRFLAAALALQGAVVLLFTGTAQKPFVKAAPLEVELIAAAGSPIPAAAKAASATPSAAATAAIPPKPAPHRPEPARPAEPLPAAASAPQAVQQQKSARQNDAASEVPVAAAQPAAVAPSAGPAGQGADRTSAPVSVARAGGGGAQGSGPVGAGAVLTQARPNYLHNPPPTYPPLAKRRGLTGSVVLKVLVGREGVAKELAVRSSSGHAVLDQAALATVSGWRFSPARRGEVSVESWVDVPIRFEFNQREG